MKEMCVTEAAHGDSCPGKAVEREIERTNARLRHFRGIAATVMSDAFQVWKEIMETLEDSRSCHDLLDDSGDTSACVSSEERTVLLEKLHLLGIQIDYARRLCEGQIGNKLREEGVF